MKYNLYLKTLTVATCLLASCGAMSSGLKNAMALQDSLQKAYPDVDNISISLQNASSVKVTLQDNDLYEATEEQHQQQADQIGVITAHIFKNQPGYTKGSVVYELKKNAGIVSRKQYTSYDMHLRK